MTSFRLSRRSFLRGAAGTGIAVGLCPLDVMFDGHGEAYAQGQPLPKRFVLFFMGNGAPLDMYIDTMGTLVKGSWVPSTEGAGYPLSPCLEPLAPVRQNVRLVTGLWNPSTGVRSHIGNLSGNLAGVCREDSTQSVGHSPYRLGGPSVDSVAAKTLGADTRFRSVQLGVCDGTEWGTAPVPNNLTFDDDGNAVPPTWSPRDVFNRLFGGQTFGPDPKKVRQQSVLDAVARDAQRLQRRLGAADRQRVDKHLTAIRELERSLDVEGSQVCTVPGVPAASTDYPTIARQMSQLVTLAFACDQTRVASYLLTRCNGTHTFPWLGLSRTHHDISHWDQTRPTSEWLADLTQVTRWHIEVYADLVKQLASVPEGAGTLLDRTLVVLTSENGNSHVHDWDDIPTLVAGGPSLVRGDFHWRGQGGYYEQNAGPSTSALWLGVLKSLDVPVSSFGDVTTPLSLR